MNPGHSVKGPLHCGLEDKQRSLTRWRGRKGSRQLDLLRNPDITTNMALPLVLGVVVQLGRLMREAL